MPFWEDGPEGTVEGRKSAWRSPGPQDAGRALGLQLSASGFTELLSPAWVSSLATEAKEFFVLVSGAPNLTASFPFLHQGEGQGKTTLPCTSATGEPSGRTETRELRGHASHSHAASARAGSSRGAEGTLAAASSQDQLPRTCPGGFGKAGTSITA